MEDADACVILLCTFTARSAQFTSILKALSCNTLLISIILNPLLVSLAMTIKQAASTIYSPNIMAHISNNCRCKLRMTKLFNSRCSHLSRCIHHAQTFIQHQDMYFIRDAATAIAA